MQTLNQSTTHSAQLTNTHPIVHVGFDTRHRQMYELCIDSAKHFASGQVEFHANSSTQIPNYTRATAKNESTSFVYSRFLVPLQQQYRGWAIFCDGDFLWQDDIYKLWEQRDDQYAAMVCQHDYVPKTDPKAFGHVQEAFPRKNWSSLIMWNCAHPANRILTTQYVNLAEPWQLHRFTHLQDAMIGSLDLRWNWLVDEYEYTTTAGALHFTNGGPWCGINTGQDGEYHGTRSIISQTR